VSVGCSLSHVESAAGGPPAVENFRLPWQGVVRRKGDEWGWTALDHKSWELVDSCRRLISVREKSGKEK